MGGWKLSSICLWAIASVAVNLLGILPTRAKSGGSDAQRSPTITEIPRLQDLKPPATTVKDWLAQTAKPIKITKVRLNSTRNFDLHKIVGIIAALFIAFASFTGFIWNFNDKSVRL